MSPPTAGSAEETPPAHPARQRIRDGILAASLANLCLASSWYVSLYTSLNMQYFRKVPFTAVKGLALFANLIWMSALIWLVIRVMRRSRSRWVRPVCEWAFLLLLLLPLDFCRQIVFSLPSTQLLKHLRQPLTMAGLVLLLLCLLFRRRWVVRAVAVTVGILSPLVLMTLARIVYAAFEEDHMARLLSAPPLPSLSPVREGQPRVVWVIFDETDYRLAFDQRPSCVQMPEFDRLRSECLSATNAVPPGESTIESVPGLMTGLRVAIGAPSDASHLELTLADTNKVVMWNDLPTVFDSARELGVNTALVGWHHPYGRVLGRSLNYCSWYPTWIYQPVPAMTLGKAMFQELECVVWNLHCRHQFRDLCETTLAESLSLATNSTYGLTFLHLPPPHKPGVFDATQGRFTLWKWSTVDGYFNNLALADLFLGKLRRAMEASTRWDKDWFILSADHSWRWAEAYDGRRDRRVPFIIKAPGSNQPIVYSPAMNTVVSHDLILAILHSELTNQQQAVAWLDAHPPSNPPTLRTAETLKGAF